MVLTHTHQSFGGDAKLQFFGAARPEALPEIIDLLEDCKFVLAGSDAKANAILHRFHRQSAISKCSPILVEGEEMSDTNKRIASTGTNNSSSNNRNSSRMNHYSARFPPSNIEPEALVAPSLGASSLNIIGCGRGVFELETTAGNFPLVALDLAQSNARNRIRLQQGMVLVIGDLEESEARVLVKVSSLDQGCTPCALASTQRSTAASDFVLTETARMSGVPASLFREHLQKTKQQQQQRHSARRSRRHSKSDSPRASQALQRRKIVSFGASTDLVTGDCLFDRTSENRTSLKVHKRNSSSYSRASNNSDGNNTDYHMLPWCGLRAGESCGRQPTLVLQCVTSTSRKSAAKKSHICTTDHSLLTPKISWTLGSSPACDLVLGAPSAAHACTIEVRGDEFFLVTPTNKIVESALPNKDKNTAICSAVLLGDVPTCVLSSGDVLHLGATGFSAYFTTNDPAMQRKSKTTQRNQKLAEIAVDIEEPLRMNRWSGMPETEAELLAVSTHIVSGGAPITFGRSGEHADIVLNDSKTAKVHANIQRQNGKFMLESSFEHHVQFGTFVEIGSADGQSRNPHLLCKDDRFRIGNCEFRVLAVHAGHATATARATETASVQRQTSRLSLKRRSTSRRSSKDISRSASRRNSLSSRMVAIENPIKEAPGRNSMLGRFNMHQQLDRDCAGKNDSDSEDDDIDESEDVQVMIGDNVGALLEIPEEESGNSLPILQTPKNASETTTDDSNHEMITRDIEAPDSHSDCSSIEAHQHLHVLNPSNNTSTYETNRSNIKVAIAVGREVSVGDLLRHFQLSTTDAEPYLLLHCVSGPLQKRVYGLVGGDDTCIGSDSSNNIVQANARRVSPLHARIVFDSYSRCYRLHNEDRHYDGTLLRIVHGAPLVLQTGDVFWMGHAKCRVRGSRNLLAPKASFSRFSSKLLRMALGNKPISMVAATAAGGGGLTGAGTGAGGQQQQEEEDEEEEERQQKHQHQQKLKAIESKRARRMSSRRRDRSAAATKATSTNVEPKQATPLPLPLLYPSSSSSRALAPVGVSATTTTSNLQVVDANEAIPIRTNKATSAAGGANRPASVKPNCVVS